MATIKESLKADKLLSLFLVLFLIFNVLFFFRAPIINSWYDLTNVQDKCPADTVDSTGFSVSNCDITGLSMIDDFVLGGLAIGALGSAVTGSMLIIRTVERRWQKRTTKKSSRSS